MVANLCQSNTWLHDIRHYFFSVYLNQGLYSCTVQCDCQIRKSNSETFFKHVQCSVFSRFFFAIKHSSPSIREGNSLWKGVLKPYICVHHCCFLTHNILHGLYLQTACPLCAKHVLASRNFFFFLLRFCF